jgi:hypothetical protein
MFNVLKTLIVDVLGIPAVAIYAVIGIFVIGLIFAIWRVISTGQ